MSKGRLIDVSKCTACRGCQVACKGWNELPAEHTTQTGTYENPPELSGSTWIKVEFRERSGEWLFRAHTCMHCNEASCEKVCPTGAISHNGEIVIIDQDWCIGCGYCVQACPFHVPHKDEEGEGTARKCRMCIDRVTNGMAPACATTCPSGAIQFGERDELISIGKNRVDTLRAKGYNDANLYGETEMGGLQTMYVLTHPPADFGLPEDPALATNTTWAHWVSGAVTAGIVAAIPFWLLFKRKQRIESNIGGGA